MKRIGIILIVIAVATGTALAYVSPPGGIGRTQLRTYKTALNYCNDLPTSEQVSTDSFTEQAFHASSIVKELVRSSSYVISSHDYETGQFQELEELVTKQLSHHDGIRGFFSIYLTQEGSDTPADADVMPAPLSRAMKSVDMALLAPLACMNVIRPVVMTCWHTDPILKENSAKTGERGKKILTYLKGSINFEKNFEAIYAVASGKSMENADEKLVKFWDDVFVENNYSEEQKKSIAETFVGFVTVKN